jgi:hypothetical protein
MAKSLRPQLNQIRSWVRQGRTDAWIAHQLEVSAKELRDFRRQHGLSAEDDESGAEEANLRDAIEAEIEAAAETETEEEPEVEEDEGPGEAEPEDEEEPDGSEAEGRPRRRRRGRRGGRGRRARSSFEATFDHGETDGFGLWLDPAVEQSPAYSEHWAGHRAVTVTIEPDQIVIRRAGEEPETSDES